MTTVRPTMRARLGQGGLAAGPALLVLVAGHLLTSRPGFLEAVSDGFGHLPLPIVGAAIAIFGPAAKGLLFVAIGAGTLAGGAVLGLLADRWLADGNVASDTLAVGLVAFFVAEVPVLWLAQAGIFGSDLAYDPLPLHVPLALACLAYGAAFAGLRAWASNLPSIVQTSPDQAAVAAPAGGVEGVMPRRTFLGRVLVLVGGASALGALGAMAAQAVNAVAQAGGAASLASFPPDSFGPTPALTPVADFYTVAKDLVPPGVDGSSWHLTVDGLVDHPLALRLADLQAMPAVSAYRTLECISTEIVRGDHLIGNQLWKGVRLADVLAQAGVRGGASWILWEAADGYTESIPLEVALHPDSWLAYEMGGGPLPAEHGYPARVLIAGRFGMKQPKWVTRLQVADHDEQGYWEQRGWDEQAVARTMSRLDYPQPDANVPVGVPFHAYGIAWAGDRGISRVEVSPDGATSWVAATLQDAGRAPLGPLTWVPWRATLTVSQPGLAQLVVRATDGTGALQVGAVTPALPSGSTGWQAVQVVAVRA
jgi:DMSO/TMAO reductase YedYZ molybdopterin-dependent catalytic subunit